MIFPKINRVYEYNNEKVVVWQQSLFNKVYLRTLTDKGGSIYYVVNWFKFMYKSKYIEELQNTNNVY